MSVSGLDVFIIAAYIILINPALYCLWKHGKHGILGWLPLQSFCIIRIVGSILAISNAATHSTSQNSLIFSNIGLSPLLIASAGILHEAQRARNPKRSSKLEWFKVINYHALIIAMTVIIIFGVLKEINDAPHTPTTLMKVGAIGFLVCWVILATWVLLSWFQPPKNISKHQMYEDGTMLLFGVLRGLPFILLRVIYTLVALFITNSNFRSNTAAKVTMSVLPELACTLILVFVGVQTRNICKHRHPSKI